MGKKRKKKTTSNVLIKENYLSCISFEMLLCF